MAGESLWSKAEKRAALSLTKYAANHSEADYQDYLAEIAVPLGDKQARLQLQTASPDLTLVYQGFVQGRNNPEDVSSMSRLFRRFGHIGHMAKAIAIWTEGDREIDNLRGLAEQLHQEIRSAHPDDQKIRAIAEQLAEVDARLTPLENDFSSTLGEGARWINRVLSLATGAATGLLLLVGIVFSVAVMSRIRNSEEKHHNLLNTANDAIVVIDASTRRVLEANNKACQLLGRSEEEVIGMPEANLYPVRDGSSGPRSARVVGIPGQSRVGVAECRRANYSCRSECKQHGIRPTACDSRHLS